MASTSPLAIQILTTNCYIALLLFTTYASYVSLISESIVVAVFIITVPLIFLL